MQFIELILEKQDVFGSTDPNFDFKSWSANCHMFTVNFAQSPMLTTNQAEMSTAAVTSRPTKNVTSQKDDAKGTQSQLTRKI